jgi:hypothetical protein
MPVRSTPSVRRRFVLGLTVASLLAAVGQAAQARQTGPTGGGGGGSGGGLTAPAATETDPLPIRRVVLYRSGVAYVERSGSIEGDATVQLRFKTEQINDILKSLIAQDRGGKIVSVNYASLESLDRRLGSFGINLAEDSSMAAILGRLRGAQVRVTTAEGDTTGTVLSVEERRTVVGDGPQSMPQAIALPWINLLTDRGVRAVNLSQASGFEILDARLRDELNKALAAIAQHRDDRLKTVELRFNGAGRRDASVAYIQEAPVWKASYRMVLPEEADGQVQLQGWAIVENTTDSDWTDVELSLVSGRPVGFQMDLYQPLFMDRPIVSVPAIAGAMPRLFDAAMDAKGPGGSRFAGTDPDLESGFQSRRRALGNLQLNEDSVLASRAPSAAPMPGRAEADLSFAKSAEMSTRDAIAASSASASEVGEVFQYRLDTPVTIERQRSAMLPIIAAPVAGRRVSIVAANDFSPHPMRGVEITNSTALQLLPGPLAVFDGSAYAGDAQIGHVSAGDKRLLAYAVDLDVLVSPKTESGREMASARIVDGVFLQSFRVRDTRSWSVSNKDAKRPRTVVFEVPKLPGHELTSAQKPTEETPGGLYRFAVDAGAGGSGTLEVVQQVTVRESAVVVSVATQTIEAWRSAGKLSNGVVQAFKTIGEKLALVREADARAAEFKRQQDEITSEQERLRANMQAIDRTSQLYGTYMTKLTDQEKQFDTLKTKVSESLAEAAQARKNLDDFVRTLNVE